jgi:hypothetical protein
MDLEYLRPFASTKAQESILNAVIQSNGVQKDAAKLLNATTSNVGHTLSRIKAKAASKTITHGDGSIEAIPDPYHMKGKSILYDEAGNVKIQWVKTDLDKEQQADNMREYVNGLCEEIPARKAKKLTQFKKHTDQLMTGIFIGDAHIGMYAHGKETKHSDFDSDIATEQLRDAIDYLVDKAELTETGLLVDVGDYLHTNGQNNMTFGGTPQDVDTRKGPVNRKAAMCMIYMIDKMLDKFKKVTVVIAKGNHDTDSSEVIRVGVSLAFRNEPRVNVLHSDGFYNYIEYGNWLLGIHHGDKQKPESLASSMARDMPKSWGRTTSRMWCVGHFHKENVKSLPGVKYKVFAALPPPDSWHASKGYMGDGEMEMLTFRKSGGLYSSHVYTIPQTMHEPDVML